MVLIIWLMCFVLYTFANTAVARVYWCDPQTIDPDKDGEKLKQIIQPVKPFLMDACYFSIKGMREKVLRQTPDGEPFSYDEAKKICKDFDATLPSVHSEEENRFISQDVAGKSGGHVLLGAKVTLPQVPWDNVPKTGTATLPDVTMWDDGLAADYKPKTWHYPKLHPYNLYSFVTPMTNSWETVNVKKTFIPLQRMVLVCKQNATEIKKVSAASVLYPMQYLNVIVAVYAILVCL